MNLGIAKNKVKSYLGLHHKFIYRGARNQIEEFEGKIINCYQSIFIIETDDHIIKSFTYNDFIIKNIKIVA